METLMRLLKPLVMFKSYFVYKYGRMRLDQMIKRGLKVGKNVYIENGTSFDPVYPYLIEIGDNCRIAMGVKILAHDATVFRELGINRIAPVRILEGCFIGERAIILPGVTIGPNAMIAAGAMVNRDIGENKIAAGNPARPYADFRDLLEKYKQIAKTAKIFAKDQIEKNPIEVRRDMVQYLHDNPVAFVHGVPRSDPYYINCDMNEIRQDAIRAYAELSKSRR